MNHLKEKSSPGWWMEKMFETVSVLDKPRSGHPTKRRDNVHDLVSNDPEMFTRIIHIGPTTNKSAANIER